MEAAVLAMAMIALAYIPWAVRRDRADREQPTTKPQEEQ